MTELDMDIHALVLQHGDELPPVLVATIAQHWPLFRDVLLGVGFTPITHGFTDAADLARALPSPRGWNAVADFRTDPAQLAIGGPRDMVFYAGELGVPAPRWRHAVVQQRRCVLYAGCLDIESAPDTRTALGEAGRARRLIAARIPIVALPDHMQGEYVIVR